MRPDNDNNETDLEKEYDELYSISDVAMVTLMEINNKIEFLNQQLEKQEKLRKKQLEREEKLQIENIEKKEKLRFEKTEQEQKQSDLPGTYNVGYEKRN